MNTNSNTHQHVLWTLHRLTINFQKVRAFQGLKFKNRLSELDFPQILLLGYLP